MSGIELNLDGLPGPTHSYAGLALGNRASQEHRQTVSHPRQAARQCLQKMKFLAELGIPQGVLPPQLRPELSVLRRLGFEGNDAGILDEVHRQSPELLAACSSSSSMWAANAATVSPSADAADRRVHITPANLVWQFHRSLEAASTAKTLRKIFAAAAFACHDPLPPALGLSDEGAANHTRLAAAHDSPGVEFFVYGREPFDPVMPAPSRFPARQSAQASRAIARLHQLDPARVVLARQNPRAIDAGAFHNDVVAVGNLNVLLYHQLAFAEPDQTIEKLQRAFAGLDAGPLHLIEVSEAQIPLQTAVATYLFNSQIVSLPDGSMAMIAPTESRDDAQAAAFLRELPQRGTPIKQVHFVDVRQSMKNGGGPACLRLRVALSQWELAAVHRGVLLNDDLFNKLSAWIDRHYREDLTPGDLRDPKLLNESRDALDALARLLDL